MYSVIGISLGGKGRRQNTMERRDVGVKINLNLKTARSRAAIHHKSDVYKQHFNDISAAIRVARCGMDVVRQR